MKKTATITLTILSALLILDSLQAGQALMMFLLAGVIPGTSTSISGSAALSLFAGLIGFTSARLATKALYNTSSRRSNLQNA